MARLDQPQTGRNATQPLAITGPRQGEIQQQQHLAELGQRVVLFTHCGTEFGQNPLLLIADPAFLSGQTIPQLNHRLGLHKHGVP